MIAPFCSTFESVFLELLYDFVQENSAREYDYFVESSRMLSVGFVCVCVCVQA